MALDCIPKRCGCLQHPHGPDLPDEGATHPDDVRCPFENDDFPKGPRRPCCSLRGKAVAHELEALGKNALSNRMYEDMTAEEAVAFADELRRAMDRLEQKHAGTKRKPKGAGWNGTWDAKRGDFTWERYSTFEEAVASVREVARWYEKVGRLGYGVFAWY